MDLGQCTKITPEIIRGEDEVLNVQLSDKVSKQLFDISLASEIDAVFLKDDATHLHKLKTTGGVVIVSGPSGKLQIILSAVDTGSLKITPDGELSSFEIRVTIAGKVYISQFKNSIKILASLFPE